MKQQHSIAGIKDAMYKVTQTVLQMVRATL
jgi:hypothetical protein